MPPESPPRSIDGNVFQQIPFLQLGRLVPYEKRKNISLDDVPTFSDVLEKRKRHSSDHSRAVSRIETALGKMKQDKLDSVVLVVEKNPSTDEQSTKEFEFDSIIPNSQNDDGLAAGGSEEKLSQDLFGAEHESTPIDNIPMSQNNDEATLLPITATEKSGDSEDSDEDLFFATPEKPGVRIGKRSMEKPSDIESMILLCSGLTVSDRVYFNDFAKKFDIPISHAMETGITHLVVNSTFSGEADRTLKFLLAITKRKWIVSIRWVKDSLDNGVILKPDQYEVLDTNGEPPRCGHLKPI